MVRVLWPFAEYRLVQNNVFWKLYLSLSIFLYDLPQKKVNMTKDLGIIMLTSNTFKEHIYHVVVKANRMLGFIKKFFCIRDMCLLIFYKANVRTNLEFGSIIWPPLQSI